MAKIWKGRHSSCGCLALCVLSWVKSLRQEKFHASNFFLQNLRSDFELKFLVDVGKTAEEEELSSASKAKLEAAVAELQNRIQKKADTDEIERISQSTQSVKDVCEKMESNMVELQSQLKRLNSGSRRASRVSISGSLIPPMGSLLPPGDQVQMLVPDRRLVSLEELSPHLLDELTKDLKETIEKHNKELEKVQKDFGLFGRSILKLSGHQQEQSKEAPFDSPEKLIKIFAGLEDDSPKLSPHLDSQTGIEALATVPPRKSATAIDSKGPQPTLDVQASKEASDGVPRLGSSTKDVLVGTVDQMDDDAVVEAINEALKTNKFRPKENTEKIARLCHELEKLTLKLQELDDVMPSLKDGLALKADKRDLQKLARYVKEQLQRPENVIFTGKPLMGFKCMSCDHTIEKLSRTTGNHMPTDRMPPQILPMLSAERIFSLDKRGSNNSGYGPPSMASTNQVRKLWVGSNANSAGPEGTATALPNGDLVSPRGRDKRPQRATPTRKGSPKKAAT